jgi:hypothetical protein
LQQRVNADSRLVWRGRYVDTAFLAEVGDTAWLIQVTAGRIAAVKRGPLVMPSWTFALRAPQEAWDAFWLPVPPPGFHDLLALVKRRALRIEGNLHPFMANLLYFKGVMAAPRASEARQ